MKRAWLPAIIVVALAEAAHAERVTVKVVEVAGGLAYLDQGRAAGVVRGTKVTFGRVTLTVTETTEKTAVVELGKATLAVGAAGIAEVKPDAASAVRALPAPRPPEAFAGAWPAPTMPAATQDPKAVPLGSGRPPGRAHVAVIAHAFAAADRDDAVAQGELRAIASFDLMTERPLAADVDIAGRAYSAGADGDARVPVFVRAAQLRYGDRDDPRLALGRLRYAASAVGMLDGARAGVRVGRLELAAFGGLVPDPISGKPETSASRFGTEVAYDAETSPWQPRASITAYGSTWEGELDERRLAVAASASRGAIVADGWAEAQAFSSDNPWGARAIELTGAGASAQWRERGTHVGADLTFLRPDRSLRLAAALPPEWLCASGPSCESDSWASASVFAGTRGARWSVDAIGSLGRTRSVDTSYDASGYLAGELRFGPQRLLAGVSAGRADFARWTAAHVGVGMVLTRKLDIAARYRPELLDYTAATEAYVQHGATLDAHVAVSPALDFALQLLGTRGPDRDAAALLTTLAWRPLP